MEQTQWSSYERLLERIIAAVRRRHAQMGGDCSPAGYARMLGEALCDENLTFTELSPGTLVVERTVAVTLDKSVDELRALLSASNLAAGVWLACHRAAIEVERIRLYGDTPLVFAEASVLVAVMTQPRDFEIARDEGWYRIPVRSAPKFFPPDYMAFYFTRAFGDQAWSVRYFAPVRGHELLTRRDLLPHEPHHPRAEQPYYKVQLGRLVQREPPIVSATWRRITFILTNGRRFSTAREINELILGPKEHDFLWRALKEGGLHAERQYVIRDERAVYRVDMAVLCRDGVVGIMCGSPLSGSRPGFPLLQFTPEQIETRLDQCLAAVQQAVEPLGGPKTRP